MATIQEIESKLLAYSLNGNFPLLAQTVNGIAANQVALVSKSAASQSLSNIVLHENYSTSNDTAIANAARNLVQKLGARIDTVAIGDAMTTFSAYGNFKALDAVTDYLSAAQKTEIGRSPAVGDTLLNIVMHDNPYSTGDNDTIAATARDLMAKLGTYVTNSLPIGDAMTAFSEYGNFKALDAVTDYLTTAQKTAIGRSPAVGDTLLNIVMHDNPTTTSDNDTIAATARDLMAKFGAYMTNSLPIGDAMTAFSEYGNFKALDAVTDYLTVAQKTEIGRSPAVGDTLLNIVMHDNPTTTSDNDAIAAVARDLMAKLGTYMTNSLPIGDAMTAFSAYGNFKALDAVTDYLNTTQKTAIGRSPAVGDTLLNIVMHDNPTTTSDNDMIAATARDLMAKLGTYMTNSLPIGDAITAFSAYGNFKALDAVTDYLSAAQKTAIGRSPAASDALLNIAMHDNPHSSGDDIAIASVVRDLMSKVGAQIDNIQSLGSVLTQFSAQGNDMAVGSILDYLTTAQFAALPPAVKADMGDVLGNHGANTLTGTAAHDTIFGMGGNDTIRGGAGNDKLFGNSGNDYLYGQDGNDILVGGLGTDTLSGGKGADTFVFDNRSGVDTITDFNRAEGDRIDLSAVLESFDPLTDAITDFVSARNSGKDTILSIDTNGTAAGGLADIAVLQNVTNLNVHDLYNTDTIIV